jgi:hypothetical protein
MSTAEAMHELYIICKELTYQDLPELDFTSMPKEEADFYRFLFNYVLQQKQKKAIEEKRF